MSSVESASSGSSMSVEVTDGSSQAHPNIHRTSSAPDGGISRPSQRYERRPSNPVPASRYHRPSLSNAINNELPPLPVSAMTSESRRQSIMAMDRKRRLTGSAHETGRRRTTAGGFMEREDRYYNGQPSSTAGPTALHETDRTQMTPVVDLTRSPPSERATRVQSQTSPESSGGSRTYVVPRWQPDSEASECPICHRPFTLLFRRHHCRKCGRVVCNDCSLHRITIPRQYIVHPPGMAPDSLTGSTRDVVDLTEDDDENTESAGVLSNRRFSNAALGGGEKVRLCNPCVPDPQPELQPNYGHPFPRPLPAFAGMHHRNTQSSRSDAFSPLAPYSARSLDDRQIPAHQLSQPHPGTRVHFPEEEEGSYETLRDAFGPASRHYVPTYTPNSRYPGYNASHSRYRSLDMNRPPPAFPLPPHYIGNRPRVRSMLDPFPHHPRMLPPMGGPPLPPPPHHGSLPPSAPRPARPRIREEDICPICRGLLPPKEPNGTEMAREAHIMECITRHDSSTPTHVRETSSTRSLSLSQSPQTNSEPEVVASTSYSHRAPMQMLRFVATEKDCVGEESNPQECSICMIEYDVGDRLARLECWCKFHEECIVEWFARKRECPVHKIA